MAKKRGKEILKGILMTRLLVILILAGTGIYFYSKRDIYSIQRSYDQSIDPSITVKTAVDNYFGEGGRWESEDGTVAYYSRNEKVKLVFTIVNEDGESLFDCNKVYYEGNVAYSGENASLFLYKIFADSSERYQDYRGDLVEDMKDYKE